MADITKCKGTNCYKKRDCYRYTATEDPYRQSFFSEIPLTEEGVCSFYWANKKEVEDG